MKIGIPKEFDPQEKRVATSPNNTMRLIKMGFEVYVESGAGQQATFSDDAYKEAGCHIVDRAHALSEVDIVMAVKPLHSEDVNLMRDNAIVISFIYPHVNESLMEALNSKNIRSLAMERIPRITRCQKMDALSSMANIAGYRAVVEAAECFGSFFTGQITAAGKIAPAKILVIGAGVAGLAAIGAARGLGAIVRAFDTRPIVKEQVESMGAEFLELDFEEDGTGEGGYAKVMSDAFIEAEMKLFQEQAQEVDIIITTALIPGRPAPKLLKKGLVAIMKEGSVIVDMAAEQGGNCEYTEPGKCITVHGVHIVGYTDLPSRMAPVASELYGNNLAHLLDDLGGANEFKFDLDDEVTRATCASYEGKTLDQPPPPKPSPQTQAPEKKNETERPNRPSSETPKKASSFVPLLLGGIALTGIGWTGDSSFLTHFTVFILSCFVGWQVIWNVSAALHTPLMAVTNAISGIIIVGGLLQLTTPEGSPALWLGVIAIFFATINIAGGFLVTHRMLKMFSK